MTPNERAGRAMRFRALIEDGEIKELLDEIEATFTNEWKAAQTADERENCFRAVRILSLLRQHMAAIVAGERDKVTAIRRAK